MSILVCSFLNLFFFSFFCFWFFFAFFLGYAFKLAWPGSSSGHQFPASDWEEVELGPLAGSMDLYCGAFQA